MGWNIFTYGKRLKSIIAYGEEIYKLKVYGHDVTFKFEYDYLTFEALEDGTFSFTKYGTGNDIQYSLDDGVSWTTLASETNSPTVTAGSKILWKAELTPEEFYGIGTFASSGEFKVEGNAMSLLYGDEFEDKTSLSDKGYTFYGLFSGCTNLVSAENLSLPATRLASSCYQYMFYDCTSLTNAPELPATTLAEACYYYMFYGCTSLNYIKCLATDISASSCTSNWVNGVASSGTFVKAASTNWSTGVNGIPSGWTVQNA